MKKSRIPKTPPKRGRSSFFSLLLILLPSLVVLVFLLWGMHFETPKDYFPNFLSSNSENNFPQENSQGESFKKQDLLPQKEEVPKQIITNKVQISPAKKPKTKPRFYLVIDDLGYDYDENLLHWLAFDVPITFAVIPFLKNSQNYVSLLGAASQEAILHMPMEPLDPSKSDSNENPILSKDTPSEIIEKIKLALEDFPTIYGMNNHMGSRITSQTNAMREILSFLHSRGVWFLDSFTTASSVVKHVGDELGIKVHQRDIFLDQSPNLENINQQINKARDLAIKNGFVIAIGHIWSNELLEVMQKRLDELKNEVSFHFLSELYLQ